MNSTILQKTSVRFTRSKQLSLTLLLSLGFLFTGYAQTISIGSPTNGTEGSTFVSYVVSLDNGASNTTGSPITGTISYAGSATAGADYTPVTSFSIPDGANGALVALVVIDDALIECNETVIAIISNVSGGITVNNASSTALIIDDECPQVQISIGNPVDAVEGSSDMTFDVFLEGGAVNTTGADITGTIDYPGSAATANVDYIPVPSFTIAPGASSTTITLVVLDDAVVEPTECVVIVLTGSPSIGVYANTTTTACILDDDAVNVGISIDSIASGAEGGTDVSFVVFLDFGTVNSTGSDIVGTISYGGTATGTVDYTSAPMMFTIPNGEFSDTLVLTVIDDFCVEFTETVEATITSSSVGSINNGTATAYILDNEAPATTISISTPTNGEEGQSDVSFIVSLDNGWTNCLGAPIVGSVAYSGTATAGADFTNVSTFSIPDGASFALLTLPVIDDLLDECDETVIATIFSPNIGAIAVAIDSAIIVDDECMTTNVDILSNVGLNVYPNPTSSVLHLKSEKLMTHYSILDINGRLLSSSEVHAKEFSVDTYSLSSGVYFIQLILDDGRIVKQKFSKE